MNKQPKTHPGPRFFPRPIDRPSPRSIGLAALQSLHQELSAYPKPGLVSPVDSGSHSDMDAATFFRSLFSLRGYFREIALAGMGNAPFAALKELGIAAEERMLKATRGVNTHRGAIFNLGLLAAAAGHLRNADLSLQNEALAVVVRERWGEAIRLHGTRLPRISHGSQVAANHGVGGALLEASSGFPHVFKVGLPALQKSLHQGADPNSAAVQCLFALMEVLPDTNLLYRGGEQGLTFAQESARAFLAAGGVHRPGWQLHAGAIHREFVALNLSPGGSADLLAATLFVYRLQS
ncbi:2'-(5''-triphosphoribosyl)-3'-dephospho-coenzyme A synthase [Desulfuromonas soudanensis]|uniref:triphosphoribosyl-dephospho-CoA synthase n=1 Tax=Desulfuromonas soudanensis TaxID=1603606 RepID=A0A0M5IKC7_9BACT|nr:triphosphoribosyl-dephospho-CoA synthase MdcB [Desulfuromonas soudanensis]ALC15174.1 2'-(5''-triphosphoribosyl)-3'-dephospho-coenzyme A synthase [Desulfuromonas soudanensis]